MTTETKDADAGASGTSGASGARAHRRRAARKPKRTGRRLTAALLLICLLATGGGLLIATSQLQDGADPNNKALTDAGATGNVAGDVGNAVARIFTYTPDTLDTTRQDAKELLRGEAAEQYDRLFARLAPRVAEQQISLTTNVIRTGVVDLTDTTAHVLLFLDQTSERKGGKPSTAAAQLSVTAEQHGGTWQITKIKAR
ncbi:hypothetical protein G5C51_19025 [Streptomyces sp. A7024]|uniref:Mce-associated membrane protein n=1 Tax=Streptomyces coryli TaxID=1128680 RepID=A0A6G4U3W1_9ACTN|nr:hypothetical protein [Streptomyces coryli]NGN65977.1 hypothetical protein [Streptomyces coryli]